MHRASENKASRAILESSIALAKKLGIHCVAEGVEEQSDWNLVTELGCEYVQGYFIAQPMEPGNFISWAKEYAANQKRK